MTLYGVVSCITWCGIVLYGMVWCGAMSCGME